MQQFYRVIATGQWCGASYDGGGAEPDAIAEALGLAAGSVEMVEVEDDPRTGTLLDDPNVSIEIVAKPGPSRDDQLADLFEAMSVDPALSTQTKSAITQAVVLLRA